MAASQATFTINTQPNGRTDNLDKREMFGTIAVSGAGGTYPANGLPLSFIGTGVYSQNPPFWGLIYGIAGYLYVFDPVHQTLRIYLCGGSSSPLVEVATNATTPAGVLTDTIYARVIVDRS